jgi:hypothetical protein
MMIKATKAERARRSPDGRIESAICRCAETRGLPSLGCVALDHWNGVEDFCGDGAGVRDAILAGPRKSAYPASKPYAREYDKYQDTQHLSHDIGVGPYQNTQCAQPHDEVA